MINYLYIYRTDKVAASEYSFDARPYAPFPESASLDGTAMLKTNPNEAIFIPNGKSEYKKYTCTAF